jgi:hypothetical protein
MMLVFFYQLRLSFSAQSGGLVAAVTESTTAGEMKRTRHHTGYRVKALFLFFSRAGKRIQ